jgi:uncharacterized protein YndB with AHSA1/START domain
MRLTQHISAPRSRVYAALLDPGAVQRWMVPDSMTSRVLAFDAREGGEFRISLTYDSGSPGVGTGKSSEQSDTFHGRFDRLVPDTEVVQVLEFESANPAMRGEMTITYTLADAGDGGTVLTGTHENVPAGVRPEDNELGWSMSMRKLAALAEERPLSGS